MTEYTIGKNKLKFETSGDNLIVKNITNNFEMTLLNLGLPKTEFDIDTILNFIRPNLVN